MRGELQEERLGNRKKNEYRTEWQKKQCKVTRNEQEKENAIAEWIKATITMATGNEATITMATENEKNNPPCRVYWCITHP